MKNSLTLLTLATFLASAAAQAGPTSTPAPKQMSRAETKQALQSNLRILKRGLPRETVTWTPTPEVADYRYLVINSDFHFDSETAKRAFATHLPKSVKLVVITSPGNQNVVRRTFQQWIEADRLIVGTTASSSSGFWSRDAFPFPVGMEDQSKNALVAHRYPRPFEGARDIASMLRADLMQKTFTFVGGNLQADEQGRCFVVDSSRLYGLTPAVLKAAYGCKEVTVLDHLAGIGDVDEVIKVLPGKKILTNQTAYVNELRGLGYQVTMLPKATGGSRRTYANSVIMDGTVFMPAYSTPTDEEAAAIYRQFGYNVVKVESRRLSDDGMGSLHCISMGYPKMPLEALMSLVGADLAD